MAYEYENTVVAELTGLGMVYNSNAHYEMADEVEEVYRKAKAWDRYISEVRERVKITVNTDDDIEKETQEIIDYYMEDDLDGV